jgi:hypothetical protein
MLTGMTEEDWSITLKVFDAARSGRGQPGRNGNRGKSVGGLAIFPCADSVAWILCTMCRHHPLFPG